MEAFELLKEYTRMCTECKDCYGCPLANTTCAGRLQWSEKEIIDVIEKTEQWSKEHPIITNADKFEEVFGHKPNGKYVCPVPMLDRSCAGVSCKTCISWWDEPYKEPEKEET